MLHALIEPSDGGAADHIERGITSIPALAEATRADRAALSALLRYLAARGVFSCNADGEVGLGELGALLTSQHFLGARAWLDLDTVAGRMDRVLFELLGVVRSGEPMYQAVHGRAFWQDLDAGKQGRVLIIEPLLDGDALGLAAAADLRMRALVGGRERSLDDYRALVGRAGLRVGELRPLPLFNRAVLECWANLT